MTRLWKEPVREDQLARAVVRLENGLPTTDVASEKLTRETNRGCKRTIAPQEEGANKPAMRSSAHQHQMLPSRYEDKGVEFAIHRSQFVAQYSENR